MKMTHVYIPETYLEKLAAIAAQRPGINRSMVIREAIAAYLEAYEQRESLKEKPIQAHS